MKPRISLAFFCSGIAIFAVLYTTQPLFPVFVKSFHVNPAMSSLSLSLSTIAMAISLPIVGAVSDALGRKNIMVFSVLSSSLCSLLSVLCPNWTSFLIIRTLLGVLVAGLPATAMAYLSEEVDPKVLGLSMGLFISGNSVGGLSGRILVSILTDLANWRTAIAVISGLSLLMGIFFTLNLPNSKRFIPQRIHPRSFVIPFRDPGLLCLFGIGCMVTFSFVLCYNYIGFRLLEAPYHLSQSFIGLIFTVYLVGTWSASWMGKVADKIGRRSVVLINIPILILGALLTLMTPLVCIICGIALVTFGMFGAHSCASSWVGRRAREAKGQASALYLFFFYMGSSVSGPIGGVAWSKYDWLGDVLLIVIAATIALILALTLTRIPNVKPVQSVAR